MLAGDLPTLSLDIAADSIVENAGVAATTATVTRSNTDGLVARLTASDGAVHDDFGCSVSISGTTAIVGATNDDDHSGSAYIFHYDGTTWNQQPKLTADDGVMLDQFGTSVSISGDHAVVGAVGDDFYEGSAYIFHYDGTTWNQQPKLTADDGAQGDRFGSSIWLIQLRSHHHTTAAQRGAVGFENARVNNHARIGVNSRGSHEGIQP